MNHQSTQSRFGIGSRITLALLGIGAISTFATSTIATNKGTEQLRAKSYDQLRTVRTTLQAQISDYLVSAQKDLVTNAESLTVRSAIPALSSARAQVFSEIEAAGLEVSGELLAKVRGELTKYYKSVLGANLEKVRQAGEVAVDAFMPVKPEAQLLQYIYTVLNPAAVGSKFQNNTASEIAAQPSTIKGLPEAFSKTQYAAKHERFHSILNGIRERNAYYDVFLVDNNGDVVYTNYKELDFHGNLKTGSEKDTGLGLAFAQTTAGEAGKVYITDVNPYAKSYDAPAIFASTKVLDEAGNSIGAMLYQLPLDRITSIMTFAGKQTEVGLGQTGEAYLVNLADNAKMARVSDALNPDLLDAASVQNLLLPDGVTRKKSAIGTLTVQSTATAEAKAGQATEAEYTNYTSTPVLGSYSKLDVQGLNWAIVAEQATAEAFAPVQSLGATIRNWGLGILGLTAVIGYLLGKLLTRPVNKLKSAIDNLAAGDDNARAEVISSDEIGSVASAFNNMVEERNAARDVLVLENKLLQRNIQDLLITVSDASDGKLDVRAKVTEGALGNLADALNLMLENVGDLVTQAKDASGEVAASATQIELAARQLNDSAGQQVNEVHITNEGVRYLSEQAQVVLANCRSAADASGNTQSSAAQGYRAVQEVVDGMQRIREIVQANAKKIKRLGDRSLEISQIVKFISEISAKTDILALNAAIEASRAGEQGRGFTVVAEEVRGLADRTRSLTAQIETLVSSIQTETAEAVVQMEEQTHEVERGAQTALGAGQALETIVASSEQSAQIVGIINQAAVEQAESAERMKTSVEQMNRLVTSTQTQVTQASGISRSLAQLSHTLTEQLDSFEVARTN